MSTNEKMANEIIEELEAEKTELLKTLESANDLIEADSKMHAKYMEKSIEIIKLAKENERLRLLNTEVMFALCDRCADESGGGSGRCPEYRADGELGRCVYSTKGYCTTGYLINKAMAEGVITK